MTADYVRALRGFSRDVRLYLFATAMLGFTVFGGVYPVLYNLYLLRLGYRPDYVGMINAVVGLAFAVASLPAGLVSRRWGGRRTMVAGYAVAILSLAVLPLAEFVGPGLQSGWLVTASLVRAVGFALYWVNARPFLMGATTKSERGHVYSVQAALFPLTGFVGSLVAGLLPGLFAHLLGVSLDHAAPYRFPLWLVPLLLLPGLVALLSIQSFDTGQPTGRRTARGRVPLALIASLSIAVFLQVTAQSAVAGFFNVYLDDALGVPTALIGAIAAAAQLLSAGAALTTPVLAKRWGNRRVFVWSSLGAALGTLPVALIPHWGAAGLGYLALMALYGITFPAVNVFQMELVSPGWRTAMSGATAMANGLSWSAVSYAGGQAIEEWGYRPLYLVGTALTLAGTLLFWALFAGPRGEPAPAEEPAEPASV